MSENEHEYDDDNDASLKDDDKMPESALKQEIGPDGEVKKKYDPKDPMRPRRKKARRACFACQRAHLTCGTPCYRPPPSRHVSRIAFPWDALRFHRCLLEPTRCVPTGETNMLCR